MMRALLVAGIALLLGGCSLGGGDGGSIEAGELEKLVLQPGDVPRVFVRFDDGRQGASDQPSGRSNPTRSGRLGGWKARYRRPGTAQTEGPLVIASLVDVFESAGGAREEYESAQTDLEGSDLAWRPVEAPKLGDDAFAVTANQGSGQTGVMFVRILWREDNAIASLDVNGFAGKLEFADAVALARKQASHIARAAS